MKTFALAAFALTLSVTAAADTYRCAITVDNPTEDTPSCGGSTQCSGNAGWAWTNRAECEITCYDSGPEPGQLVSTGTARCNVIADDGEPDCGGVPCQ